MRRFHARVLANVLHIPLPKVCRACVEETLLERNPPANPREMDTVMSKWPCW